MHEKGLSDSANAQCKLLAARPTNKTMSRALDVMINSRSAVIAMSLICASPLALAGAADVIAATARQVADGTWTFSVTMRCDDKSATHFCDRFEILTPTLSVVGVRRFLHDHTREQPFTREIERVKVPHGFPYGVLIRGHHSIRGYDGATIKLDLPPRGGS
jgi:hypothetical protein